MGKHLVVKHIVLRDHQHRLIPKLGNLHFCPLCKPVFATVALFVAVGQWNSWFDAMLYNRMNSDLTTLQYELMKLLSSVTNQGTSAEAMKNAVGTVTPTSVRSAATILTMLPIICIYPFLQKYFVTGLTLGGVKE